MKYYPEGTENILKSFEGEFQSCFILFHPFLKMNFEEDTKERNSSIKENENSSGINDLIKGISLPSNATIYASNPNYPGETEIIKNGTPIEWRQILKFSEKLNSYRDIQKGLKTSIGAYRRIFQREDLMNAVNDVLKRKSFWAPKEDDINTLTKILVFRIFNLLSVESVVNLILNTDSDPIDITNMSKETFCNTFNSTVIYAANKELMICQDRDTFFCLMLTKQKKTMEKILEAFNPEGILCDSTTCLPWEFENNEFQELLNREKIEKERRKQMEENKTKGWFYRIFGK